MVKGRVLLSVLSLTYGVRVSKLVNHQEALAAFSDAVFDSDAEDPEIGGVMSKVADKVDLASALNDVKHKEDLPPSVVHMVQAATASNTSSFAGYDESSLEKARTALNSLIEKAWIELDDKILKCKGFADMNRENFAQVNRDLSRLIEQITDMERVEAEAIDGSNQADIEIKQTEAFLATKEQEYEAEFRTNDAELTIRKNDLEVFQFILEFTKCEETTTALVQTSYQVCQTNSGRRTFLFNDKNVAKRYKHLLTKHGRRTVDDLLTSTHSHGTKRSLLQITSPVVGEDGLPCATDGLGDEDECMKSCNPDDTPDCGLLHDKLSLMWGEFKDGVDDLTMEMQKNADKWRELKESLNAQITLLTKKKARFDMLLAEARSNLASDRQEKKEKEVEKRTLEVEYQSYMTKCRKRIEWIMYQDMCAIKIVRNAIMETSTVCPTASIVDCDVSAWVPGECSVSCDDSCDPRKPFECGGWRTMQRDEVVVNDQCGIKCPALSKEMRCGQYLCPVDCVMSEWSDFSACSAECGGGVQARTRSILVKPKNGGESCSTPHDSRPCNTGSCDRDCKLARWTRWSGCSVACGGGVQQKRRHVLIPTRGDGKCPTVDSRKRYRQRNCNTQECQEDEVCVAKQDLVVAIDGSGSLTEEGFNTLKAFAETLISRYQTRYYGRNRVKIGICQFGNGEIMSDGKTVTPAINVQALGFDHASVLTAVKDLPYKKGFTNLAQAFATAEEMFTQGSRRNAQSSVLVITDGKPSFSFMTTQMVEQLDDKAIMRYFVVVNDQGINSDAMARIKAWASQPWETNVVHVAGLDELAADSQLWAQRALTKFCPQAYSPGQREQFELENGFQKVYQGGYCDATTEWRLEGEVSADDAVLACKRRAQERGEQIFLVMKWKRTRSKCYSGKLDVSPTLYDTWFQDKTNPECTGGSWRNHWRYTYYAIYPADQQVCATMGINVHADDDCTGKEIWHWAGGHTDFNPSEWSTETYDQWGGAGTCVTYARTSGRNCKQYCESYGKACTRGQDDAHNQWQKLSYWLNGQGKAGTRCTAYDEGHDRQDTAENGCLQNWQTQICACK